MLGLAEPDLGPQLWTCRVQLLAAEKE